jgi:hypothetical protein
VARADIWEVHPGVSLRAIAGHHLAWPKTSWNGFHERVELLHQAGIEIPPSISHLCGAFRGRPRSRIAEGMARCLPNEPTQFVNDRPLVIWY